MTVKMKGARWIDVPPSSREIKAWFWSEPSQAVKDEILEHIRAAGLPHLCKYHTHTKPPVGSKPMYIAEFTLPEKLSRVGTFAACPCCTPESAKYYKGGKIAWFPEEGVIRLLGPDCFAALNPEWHAREVKELARRKNDQAVLDALISNFDALKRAQKENQKHLRNAEAFDVFSTHLRQAFYEKIAISIWPEIRNSGQLQVWRKDTKIGKEYDLKKFDNKVFFGTLRGYTLLDPDYVSLAPDFQSAADAFLVLDGLETENDWKTAISRFSPEDRAAFSEKLSRANQKRKIAIQKLREMKLFIRPETLATIRKWSRDDGCNLDFDFDFKADRHIIVAAGPRTARVPFPVGLY